MTIAGCLNASRDLRVGVYGVKRGFCGCAFFHIHRKHISVYHRSLTGKAFVKMSRLYQIRKCREFALVLSGIIDLKFANIVECLLRGAFVSRFDHNIPTDAADADKQADDRDHDHQLDQVKTALVFKTNSEIVHRAKLVSQLFTKVNAGSFKSLVRFKSNLQGKYNGTKINTETNRFSRIRTVQTDASSRPVLIYPFLCKSVCHSYFPQYLIRFGRFIL